MEDKVDEGGQIAMLPHLGPLEIGLIVILVLIVFGVGKLPQVGGALGKGIREFRKAKDGMDEDAKTISDKASEDPEGKKIS
jgi:sec-independent protein translocase protein TatA